MVLIRFHSFFHACSISNMRIIKQFAGKENSKEALHFY